MERLRDCERMVGCTVNEPEPLDCQTTNPLRMNSKSFKQTTTTLLAAAGLFLPLSVVADDATVPAELRDQAGFIVFIGGVEQSEEIVASLDPETRRVVHWLDPDPEAVRQARVTLQEQGLYGLVTVETWNKDHLPYAENLANAVIVHDVEAGPDEAEILRVLAPKGKGYLFNGREHDTFVKPRPSEMSDWTHTRRDADGNPLSPDTAFDIPNGFQWLAGPAFPFGPRKSSANTVLSAGGRIFSITHNTVESLDGDYDLDHVRQHPSARLEARDGFNGLHLWSIPWSGRQAMVATSERLYTAFLFKWLHQARA